MPEHQRKLRQAPTQAPLPFEKCQLVSAAEPVGSGPGPSSASSSAKHGQETSDPASRTLMPSSKEHHQVAESPRSIRFTARALVELLDTLKHLATRRTEAEPVAGRPELPDSGGRTHSPSASRSLGGQADGDDDRHDDNASHPGDPHQ